MTHTSIEDAFETKELAEELGTVLSSRQLAAIGKRFSSPRHYRSPIVEEAVRIASDYATKMGYSADQTMKAIKVGMNSGIFYDPESN